MDRLKGKIALVTGGSRGIGRAISLGFAREGADVAIVYARNPDAAEATVREIRNTGRRGAAYRANVAIREQIVAAVEKVVADFGRVDILVNNAGVIARGPFWEMPEDDLNRQVDVNFKGPFFCAQAIAPRMIAQGGGCIINTTSEVARRTGLNFAVYSATKAGLAHLTRCMAVELAPYNVRVNAIAPGLTETDLNRDRIADPSFLEPRLARIPLRRVGTPDDLAEAAIYLASDGARMVTGAEINVDGGSTVS